MAKTIINHPVITIFFGVLCLPSPSHGCVFMALFCHVLPTENPSDLPLSTQLPASHALIRWSSSSLKDNSTEPADWRWFSTATQIVASNEKSGGFQQKHRCHPQKIKVVPGLALPGSWTKETHRCLETLKKTTKRSKDHGDSLKACWQYKKINIKHY